MEDMGSHPKYAEVLVEGVSLQGVVDTGSDLTIMGKEAFKKVAMVAKLRKKDFCPADKKAYNYDGKPFTLDDRLQLNLTFGEYTMSTPVYVKMDAEDQLLLSEGVCRQLGIVSYHPNVCERQNQKVTTPPAVDQETTEEVKVPTVRVKLLNSVRLLPNWCTPVAVSVEGGSHGDLLVSIEGEPALIRPDKNGTANVLKSNATGWTRKLDRDTPLGEVEVLLDMAPASVNVISAPSPSNAADRQQKLESILDDDLEHLSSEEANAIKSEMLKLHNAFVQEDGEPGETDLTRFNIDTGDAPPKKQTSQRIPFAAREEVDKQIDEMESTGVIRPSSSAWASPIVLVKKKDGGMRFCVDSRQLNSVTKKDTYPLPRIDDLLDQLGKARFFSTLDLAAGYWQIRMAPEAQEKMAFVTRRGLYELPLLPSSG